MAHDAPRFDGRMSDAEALMWRLEKDRHLSSTFANLTILDRPPDLALLRERMRRATVAVPRLRQCVEPAPGGIGAPAWVDDPEFDVRWHVRRIALAPPGSMRQLQDLAALIASDPFDRTRPLWQFTVVEGLVDGRAALIQKLHHTFADGQASISLSMQFLDLERTPVTASRPVGEPNDDDAPGPDAPVTDATSDAGSPLGGGDPVGALLAELARGPLAALRNMRDLIADPTALSGEQVAATLRALAAELGESGAARSPLWTQRSLRRRMEVLSAPFEPMRSACRSLGGTLNVGFLTAVAHATGRYHDALGAPTESLRASMAISTRTAESGTNAFTLARLLVPTSEMPLAERFSAVQESLATVRERSQGGGLEPLARISGMLPVSLLTRIARTQGQSVDFATSNVRGAGMPLYVAGSKVLANHPLGPLGGAAVNVTMLGYDQRLDLGIHLDEAAVEDPALLVSCLRDAMSELCALAPRSTPAPAVAPSADAAEPPVGTSERPTTTRRQRWSRSRRR
jgi:WS/DGAT/MGAT family acyltransferase